MYARSWLNLFKSCAYFDSKISASLWCFTNVAPQHAQHLLRTTGFGLGINTMEGREQKHQQIFKYSANTTVQEKWNYIFRHEYIQLVYLRENGFDVLNVLKYRERNSRYVPECSNFGCTICSLILNSNSECDLCSTNEFKVITEKVASI